MAAESRICPDCGAVLAARGPCPACLMQLGLAADATAATQAVPEAEAPSGGTREAIESLQQLLPQYEFLSVLGEGGMGTVYAARQKSLDRDVALKVIKPQAAVAEGFADRFSREAKALAKLSHPNIVTVHDFGQVDDQCYFVMEHVDGVNLRAAMAAGQIRPEDALQIVPQICDALQYAHEEGVVHRDIKPENILIDRRGRVKIADFGLAKLMHPSAQQPMLTHTHQVMGTMHYMAPEQLERPTEVDHRADIYSLGVVLYEMMTGSLPIGRFPLPSEQQMDERLDDVVLRTLNREPDERFQQASELRTAVEQLSQNVQPAAPPVKPAPIDDMVARAVPPVVHGVAKPDEDDDLPWMFNPGMLMGSLIFLAVGLVWIALGLKLDDQGFLWVGIGLTLGSGLGIGGAWNEDNRVKPSARADLSAFGVAATMLAVGLGMVVLPSLGRLPRSYLWIGLGLLLGGSGCLSGAWAASTRKALLRKEDKNRPATASVANALFVLSILEFVVAGLVTIGMGIALPMGIRVTFFVLIVVGASIIGASIVGGLMIAASQNMSRSQSYTVAKAGAIAAMTPISLLWPVTLPFGIWAMTVLASEGVRSQFSED